MPRLPGFRHQESWPSGDSPLEAFCFLIHTHAATGGDRGKMSRDPEFTAHQFMDLLTPLLLSSPVLPLLAVGDRPGVPTHLAGGMAEVPRSRKQSGAAGEVPWMVRKDSLTPAEAAPAFRVCLCPTVHPQGKELGPLTGHRLQNTPPGEWEDISRVNLSRVPGPYRQTPAGAHLDPQRTLCLSPVLGSSGL